MVAIIKTGTSIRRTFLYNENKVNEGVARCLTAANYPVDLEHLTSNHKLNMLLKIAGRNQEVIRNSVHISLNFAPGEDLTDLKMQAIAEEYMDQIGFGKQPYLVYRHEDAGHPHVHIVTTKIRPDATKIDMQNIGKNQSETARKILELKYNLVKAEDHKRNLFHLRPVSAERVVYGKYGTKKAIGSTLEFLINRYHFTSIPELNAVLNLYNIHADTGSENSRIYKHKGLVFRILDRNGKPVGVPVKASLFHFNPKLENLQKIFVTSQTERKAHANKLKTALMDALRKPGNSRYDAFKKDLKRRGIDVVPRLTATGELYGITYVDHISRCVFNGSTLDKCLSAKQLSERFGHIEMTPTQPHNIHTQASGKPSHFPTIHPDPDALAGLLHTLMEPENVYEPIPFELKKSRKKRKKRKQSPPQI